MLLRKNQCIYHNLLLFLYLDDIFVFGRALVEAYKTESEIAVFPRIIELLKEKNASDIVVFGGGVIPETDIPCLLKAGVAHIFTPGTPTEETVKFLAETVKPKDRA